jgi:sugar phosphate isomerase/epimerase
MAEDLSAFSFSTSWNWRNSLIGRELMEEIMGLGFSRVELNYKISEEMLETIEPLVERGELAVSSVHNVFPDVKDERFDTDSRLLGYEDPELRARSVELAIRSVDFAARLGAKAVVVHPGEAPIGFNGGPSGRDFDEKLKKLVASGKRDTEEYRDLLAVLLKERDAFAAGELERIAWSLETISEHIERKGLDVRIGLENRAMYYQIPTFAEMNALLARLSGAPVGPWFDMGHGAMMRHLGLFDDRIEAKKLTSRLVGVHIHDVDGVDDHFAPYEREGLDDYLDIIASAPIKVLELGAKNTNETVRRGAERLARVLRER